MLKFLKKVFGSQRLEEVLQFSPEHLSDLYGYRQGGPSQKQRPPFLGHLSILIEIAEERSFPVTTEIQIISAEPFYFGIIGNLQRWLSLRLGEASQKSLQELHTLRWIRFDSSARQRGQYDQRWTWGADTPSGNDLTWLTNLRSWLAPDLKAARFAFERTDGMFRLVNGYEWRTDYTGRMLPEDAADLTLQLEKAVGKYAHTPSDKFIVVHFDQQFSKRGWCGYIRRRSVKCTRPDPLTWDRDTTRWATQAIQTVGPGSAAFKARHEANRKEACHLEAESGIMDFGWTRRHVELIGSFRDADYSWLWAWNRRPGEAPPTVLHLREQLSERFPKGLLRVTSPDYFDFEILPLCAAYAAGYPIVWHTYYNDIDTFFAVQEKEA